MSQVVNVKYKESNTSIKISVPSNNKKECKSKHLTSLKKNILHKRLEDTEHYLHRVEHNLCYLEHVIESQEKRKSLVETEHKRHSDSVQEEEHEQKEEFHWCNSENCDNNSNSVNNRAHSLEVHELQNTNETSSTYSFFTDWRQCITKVKKICNKLESCLNSQKEEQQQEQNNKNISQELIQQQDRHNRYCTSNNSHRYHNRIRLLLLSLERAYNKLIRKVAFHAPSIINEEIFDIKALQNVIKEQEQEEEEEEEQEDEVERVLHMETKQEINVELYTPETESVVSVVKEQADCFEEQHCYDVDNCKENAKMETLLTTIQEERLVESNTTPYCNDNENNDRNSNKESKMYKEADHAYLDKHSDVLVNSEHHNNTSSNVQHLNNSFTEIFYNTSVIHPLSHLIDQRLYKCKCNVECVSNTTLHDAKNSNSVCTTNNNSINNCNEEEKKKKKKQEEEHYNNHSNSSISNDKRLTNRYPRRLTQDEVRHIIAQCETLRDESFVNSNSSNSNNTKKIKVISTEEEVEQNNVSDGSKSNSSKYVIYKNIGIFPLFVKDIDSNTTVNKNFTENCYSVSNSSNSHSNTCTNYNTSIKAQRGSLPVMYYCRNVITPTLDDIAFTLLQGLFKEQQDLKRRKPLQFKAHQRYVIGLNETLKFLRSGRIKCVILASDIEVEAEKEIRTTTTTTIVTEGNYHIDSNSNDNNNNNVYQERSNTFVTASNDNAKKERETFSVNEDKNNSNRKDGQGTYIHLTTKAAIPNQREDARQSTSANVLAANAKQIKEHKSNTRQRFKSLHAAIAELEMLCNGTYDNKDNNNNCTCNATSSVICGKQNVDESNREYGNTSLYCNNYDNSNSEHQEVDKVNSDNSSINKNVWSRKQQRNAKNKLNCNSNIINNKKENMNENNDKEKSTRKVCAAMTQNTHEQTSHMSHNNSNSNNNNMSSAFSKETSVIPCITCMSRQRLAYALFAKKSSIACVGVIKAEKNHELLKAFMLYSHLLQQYYEELAQNIHQHESVITKNKRR